MSLGIIVTRLAWIAQRLVSSNKLTRYAFKHSHSSSKMLIFTSDASCKAKIAVDWKRRSFLKS